MPPITSPRRTAFTHVAPPHAHPGARPIPGPHGGGGSSSSGGSASASSSPHRHASAAAAAAHASLAAVAAAAASVSSSSPSTGTSPNGFSTSPRNNNIPHPAPYMVALAGWPEPVFVAEARDMWEKRKASRPGSPTGRMAPFGAMEVRDGMALPPPLAALDPSSGPYRGALSMSRSGSTNDPLHRSRGGSPSAAPSPGRHAASPAFPTSSARDNPSSPPDGATPPPPPAEGEPLGPPPVPAHARGADAARPRRLVGGFTDPRYGLNAAAVGRTANRAALRVAPAWHSAGTASHATPPYAGTHGPVGPGAGRGGGSGAAGAHRTRTPGTMSPPALPGHATSSLRTQRAGAAAHRANPEVYPPPNATAAAAAAGAAAPAPHMATAVYPRDPDSPFMWQGLSAPTSANASTAASPANRSDEGSPRVGDEEGMDVDDE
ncbi:uncharacterized protein LOC62_01G001302 [Vanrija pseudolonga]|uniref:Uncharacterized protein n=1 Tax=Vanrija pseudolonga TaxID=143232 RepID=A0AAF0Y0T0_9TREE|nr:hypothetical protein LOC62_01G001302 [Vanrija pseudolonga]